ncbi:unnamed protein product [Rhizophagus irregularis]|uniref:Uncharacterized protein n=1 Tax=Rhizophagus irregularis TaxID=588596 RepID=A0A916DYN3_9GLOM|nr:unnamed protein product [Rhizophagus irregularis]CAB5295143.1 unnamed protein product [Rhizophagus irregularis]
MLPRDYIQEHLIIMTCYGYKTYTSDFYFLFRVPINVLFDPKQNELSYQENFVNPILAKLFDDIMEIIRVKTGDIENISNKTNKMKSDNTCNELASDQSDRCHQDGIFEVNVNATTLEIGFLKVVGNVLIVNIKKLDDDLNKVLKEMQISLFYQ